MFIINVVSTIYIKCQHILIILIENIIQDTFIEFLKVEKQNNSSKEQLEKHSVHTTRHISSPLFCVSMFPFMAVQYPVAEYTLISSLSLCTVPNHLSLLL